MTTYEKLQPQVELYLARSHSLYANLENTPLFPSVAPSHQITVQVAPHANHSITALSVNNLAVNVQRLASRVSSLEAAVMTLNDRTSTMVANQTEATGLHRDSASHAVAVQKQVANALIPVKQTVQQHDRLVSELVAVLAEQQVALCSLKSANQATPRTASRTRSPPPAADGHTEQRQEHFVERMSVLETLAQELRRRREGDSSQQSPHEASPFSSTHLPQRVPNEGAARGATRSSGNKQSDPSSPSNASGTNTTTTTSASCTTVPMDYLSGVESTTMLFQPLVMSPGTNVTHTTRADDSLLFSTPQRATTAAPARQVLLADQQLPGEDDVGNTGSSSSYYSDEYADLMRRLRGYR